MTETCIVIYKDRGSNPVHPHLFTLKKVNFNTRLPHKKKYTTIYENLLVLTV
jgi:hypothetical protein